MRSIAIASIACFLSFTNVIVTLPPLHNSNNILLLLAQAEAQNATSLQPKAPNVTASDNLSHISQATKIQCYHKGHHSTPIDLLACFPLIADLISKPDFDDRVIWPISRAQMVDSTLEGCTVQIYDGAASDVFSLADVVDAMEAVLQECQPEVKSEYGGTGGQKGVGKTGFVVRVVGERKR